MLILCKLWHRLLLQLWPPGQGTIHKRQVGKYSLLGMECLHTYVSLGTSVLEGSVDIVLNLNQARMFLVCKFGLKTDLQSLMLYHDGHTVRLLYLDPVQPYYSFSRT